MDKYCLSLLCNMEGWRAGELALLLAKFSGAAALWRAADDELSAAGLSREAVARIAAQRKKHRPEGLAEFCAREGVRVMTYRDRDYPSALANIKNAPLAFFVKGSLPAGRKLAIVGSRKASAYGIAVAKQFATDLARGGLAIVSGGAKGIDSAAHEGALAAPGQTIAVFGCGMDVCYPKENKRLYEEIVANGGALVTEYLPGDQPIDWHFPARNRIISGLCSGVLVVEANKKSGSLITADLALEEGREVYCVPGSIYSAGSAGVHSLIKQGARLVDQPEDIIADYNGLFLPRGVESPGGPGGLAADAKLIYDSLVAGRYYSLDEITAVTGLGSDAVAVALLELELSGWAEANAGMYRRKEGK